VARIVLGALGHHEVDRTRVRLLVLRARSVWAHRHQAIFDIDRLEVTRRMRLATRSLGGISGIRLLSLALRLIVSLWKPRAPHFAALNRLKLLGRLVLPVRLHRIHSLQVWWLQLHQAGQLLRVVSLQGRCGALLVDGYRAHHLFNPLQSDLIGIVLNFFILILLFLLPNFLLVELVVVGC
jgi:hypothetical protein